jgi:hypothetical protein
MSGTVKLELYSYTTYNYIYSNENFTLSEYTAPEQLTMTADDINIKNIANGKMYGSLFDGTVTLSNNNNVDFEGNLTLKVNVLFKIDDDGGWWSTPHNVLIPVSIMANQTKTIPFNYSGLTVGDQFMFTLYAPDGTALETSGWFIEVVPGISMWKGNGERNAVAPTTHFEIPEDVCAVSLEDLGSSLSSYHFILNSNPNTIYYFDADATIPSSLSGKNVVKGYKTVGNFNLQDGYGFFVPKMFTVNGTASYSRTTTIAGTEQAGWSTIVLPFTVSQVKNADANQQINWRHPSDNENKDFWVKEFKGVNDTKVIFENLETWMPNEPYIISVPSALTGKKMVFSNTNTQVYPTETCKKVTNDYSFIGTPFNQTLSDVYVMNVGGTAFQPSDNATVNAGNAYFTLAPTLSPRPTNIPISTGLLGDANGDGVVNISDAVLVVNYILGDRESDIVFENADINQDNEINVTDAVGIVNIILGQ